MYSWTYLGLAWLVRITCISLITCPAISFLVAVLISTNNSSNIVAASTWKHLKGNSCLKSAYVWDYSSSALVNIVPNTHHQMMSVPTGSWILIVKWIVFLILSYCRCNQSAASGASHLFQRLRVDWVDIQLLLWFKKYQFRTIYAVSQYCRNIRITCFLIDSHKSICRFFLASIRLSLIPEACLLICPIFSQSTASTTFQYWSILSTAAHFRMSPKTLEFPSFSAVVYFKGVSNCSTSC